MKIHPVHPCMYCNNKIRIGGVWVDGKLRVDEIDPKELGWVSHSICPGCKELQAAEWKRYKVAK